jgi:hypothetical protein
MAFPEQSVGFRLWLGDTHEFQLIFVFSHCVNFDEVLRTVSQDNEWEA